MSKILKRTPVPLPGSKPKISAKPTSALSKPPLSQELIEGSDSSATEAAPRGKAKEKAAKPKMTTSIAVHRPKLNEESRKSKKAVPKPAKKPKKAAQEVQEVSSSEESSEEGSGESSEEISEDEEDKSKETMQSKHPGRNASGDASGSASSSDNTSDESDEEPTPAATQQTTPNSNRTPQSHAVQFRPAQAYIPPKNFTVIPTPFSASTPATNLFSNIERKQIWHITAPSNVPLSSIKQLAMDNALSGESVLNHNGIDYGFSADDKDDQSTRGVLIPSQGRFKAVPTGISKTLHLQQIVRLPNLPFNDTQPPNPEPESFITSTAVREPRPQVKGLKMNFFPSGSSATERGTLGESDSETEAPARARPVMTNGTLAEKRKHGGGREERREAREELPTKKSKKHRTHEEIRKREEKKAKKGKKKEKGGS